MKNRVTTLIFLFFAVFGVYAQSSDTIRVGMRGNVQQDKIQLRWAAMDVSSWNYTNRNGFMLERYTLVRNGQALAVPERTLLTPLPMRAKPLDDWEDIVQRNDFAAIIAQALFGENFDTSEQGAVSQIIAHSREMEQRFGFSLYAADLSFEAALYAGWGFEDRNVRAGERYLYTLSPVSPDGRAVDTVMIFTGLDDYEPLPAPMGLVGIFGNEAVLLAWDFELLDAWYGAYFVERSRNNVDFTRISDLPITNITGGSRIFFTDSIANGVDYFYRVVGVTAFGEISPPSNVVEGKGIPQLIYVPHITHAMPDDKGGNELFWEFDEQGNELISSFELWKSPTERDNFQSVIENISPTSRSVLYENPLMTAFYTIRAIPKQGGEPTESFVRMVQMEDSIPPAIPTGLAGTIDSLGIVRLHWDANTDEDLLGYRVFRAQTAGEELIPLNDVVLTINEFTDTIPIFTLNANVYYAVTATDRRYNQSEQSPVLVLKRPEVVPPTPPMFVRFEATNEGNALEWVTGGEAGINVVIVRTRMRNGENAIIQTVADADNIKSYLDREIAEGEEYVYELYAENSSGLQSSRSPSVRLRARVQEQSDDDANTISSFRAARTREGIRLNAEHNLQNIRSVSIYRQADGEEMTLWQQSDDASQRQWIDQTARTGIAYEYMLAIRLNSGKIVSANVTIR
jgi:hypothetical protein